MASDPSRGRSRRRRRLRRSLYRSLKLTLLALVLVSVVSLTVGTGIASVDRTVDDVYSGLSDVASGLTESPDDGAGDGGDRQLADDGTERSSLELAIHDRVNEARTERGLDPIAFDVDLREVARSHAEDMAEREYFSHESPEGETLEDRYERFDYDCRIPAGTFSYKTGGENLFKYLSSVTISDEELADRAVEGWLDSPGHRRNLLDEDWRQEGIGVATASDGTIYVTQNFC